MITITEQAQQKIKEMQTDMPQAPFLRVGVTSACCNELRYALSLSSDKAESDVTVEFGDVIVLVNPADVRFVKNIEIDYQDDGFIIHNPNPLVSVC
ncbi:HesB/IscA family protein [Paenibacillus xerothermodurans]|uniref:Iron-sulfur cluster assembly accessory protein n=1 Tax=Paenibacillus xerothermodurans TaxID=1977292 RepID=A0A2W1NU15_PAEXE|nr:iron-sulfur cluster assembly accessory protein [Paenibacillus xerothermodurans]PZE21226.1 iron-sulfur cluster assembly accessory protein [Paenibacillus xerothermodurans]